MPSQNGMEGVQQRRTESFEVIIFIEAKLL